MALEIREETIAEVRVLGLTGRLDTDTAADLELAAQDLIDAGARDFIVDLGGVGYVSSAGLRVLLMIGKSIDGKGSLRLCGLNATVRQVFDVAGFTQLFVIGADRNAVLAKANAKPAVAAAAAESGKDNALALAAAKLLAAEKSAFAGARVEAALAAAASRLLALA
ncbi:MAG TPA: STAS domain-containing protein [Dokdonella sp.]|nr:STAS domain-containing protein [Dokdonella sp.]